MKFIKKVSLGQFLKKGEDIKENDIIKVANEGKKVPGEFGDQDVFLVKLEDGREGNLAFNSTSINAIIDAYGEESKNWIGKELKVWMIRMAVQGKIKPVYYFTHPDAELNEEGTFVLPVKNKSKKKKEEEDIEIPIVEDQEPTEEELEETFGEGNG
ncbi:MAG: hypothetical protein PHT54_03440 [Candidatus Nanoarchaeia archaeon]|nr:hypothetical protein [Candidatus Nanoarchaeia archaeon]